MAQRKERDVIGRGGELRRGWGGVESIIKACRIGLPN